MNTQTYETYLTLRHFV